MKSTSDAACFVILVKKLIIMRIPIYICLFLALWLSSYAAVAQDWILRERSASVALATEAKMPDEDEYKGVKLFLEGRYLMKSEQLEGSERRKCCVLPSRPTEFYGLLDGAVHIGLEGSGLEFISLELTPWGRLYEPGTESEKDWRATKDILKVGATRYIKDEPLELDHYLEVALGQAGRLIEYRPSAESPHRVTFGVQATTGWAWAESENQAYSSVSNPFAGIYLGLNYDHDKWGGLYIKGRFVNGFSFSNPSRGHPTAREAVVSAGYRLPLSERINVHFFWTKRSFYFDEGDLPQLYSWVRTYAAELAWRFE